MKIITRLANKSLNEMNKIINLYSYAKLYIYFQINYFE